MWESGKSGSGRIWKFQIRCTRKIDAESAGQAMVNTWDEYGMDEEAPFPDVDTDNDVIVPEAQIQLNVNQQLYLDGSRWWH